MQKPPKFDAFVYFLQANPKREYDSSDSCTCAMAQFLGGMCRSSDEVEILGGSRMNDGSAYDLIFDEPLTFGALAERLERVSWTQ